MEFDPFRLHALFLPTRFWPLSDALLMATWHAINYYLLICWTFVCWGELGGFFKKKNRQDLKTTPRRCCHAGIIARWLVIICSYRKLKQKSRAGKALHASATAPAFGQFTENILTAFFIALDNLIKFALNRTYVRW